MIYCWTFLLLYGVTFSSVANYGLLTRQRSLALPALFVLLAVDPAFARPSEDRSGRSPDDRVPTAQPGLPRGG